MSLSLNGYWVSHSAARVCIAIPVAGGRIFETGLEELFRLKRERHLGDGEHGVAGNMSNLVWFISLVPIIAVFTKLDRLVSREMRKLAIAKASTPSTDGIQKKARENADEAFKEECLTVFQETVGNQIPYKAISSKSTEPCDRLIVLISRYLDQEGYESTLDDLIQITFDNVKEHVAKEASIVTAIAQKVSPSVKIKGSIE